MSDIDESTEAKSNKPAAARQLTFESRGATDMTNPSPQQTSTPTTETMTASTNSENIGKAPTDSQNIATETHSAEPTCKRKPTAATDSLQNFNPTKRERYPE